MKISKGARISQAITHLKRVDPKLGAVIEAVGPYRLEPRTDGTHFEAVARAIVYQQLSGKAAGTIHGRFVGLFNGEEMEARRVLKLSDEAMRGVGLSRQKMGYLRDLAARVHERDVVIEAVDAMPDEEVIEALTKVKGVGRWTAQMFLMFRLGRLDVLPELDLGIQKGLQKAYRMRARPTGKRVLEVGKKWAPYRTVASWYLWRSLEVNGAE